MGRPNISEEKRELILNAFEDCVVRLGLAETRLQDVAETVNLPRSVVRYFIGNRQDMVLLMISRLVKRLEQRLAALLPEGNAIDAEALIDFLFDQVFGDVKENRITAELWYLSSRDEEIGRQMHDIYSKLVNSLAEQIGQIDLKRSPAARLSAAHSIISLALGTSNLNAFSVFAKNKQHSRALARSLINSGL